MKTLLIILIVTGFFGGCGKISTPDVHIGKKATSVLGTEKNGVIPTHDTDTEKKEKDYAQMGFSAMGLPGRF
jgi:hypothetical protein